jgi:catechol 2,3-dioxygenase-like lactoylglutathione lyase family enzyme/uncharacterized protein YunC (DUF1805 family)
MAEPIPRTVHREMLFEHGQAIGISNRWERGQYCSILTRAGLVGCGIYDLEIPAEFGQAIAIARGTPASPLVEPEDLLDARIIGMTPRAAGYGIQVGMTGREAVERLLMADPVPAAGPAAPAATAALRVKCIDHVTVVVKDLESSRRFYADILGMREIHRPAFSFAGSWFQAGTTQIHLILEYTGSGPAGNLLPAAQRTPRTQHLAFAVDDAEAAFGQLQRFDVPVVASPKPRPDGYMQAFVADPDGHVIELCSPPKVLATTEARQ